MKTCRKCGVEFEGRACPACQKVRSAKHYAANRSRMIASAAQWKAANRTKVRARSKESYAKNKKVVSAYFAKFYLKHREKYREREARYRKMHPDAKRIRLQNYRAKKRVNGGALSRDLSERLWVLQNGRCACCALPLGDDYHMDHIMPIALGGENEDRNIQLLRQRCNNEKHAKHPVDFMQERGFLL